MAHWFPETKLQPILQILAVLRFVYQTLPAACTAHGAAAGKTVFEELHFVALTGLFAWNYEVAHGPEERNERIHWSVLIEVYL